MSIDINFGREVQSQNKPIIQGKQRVFGRVIDIILDDTHLDYRNFGKVAGLGGIKYKVLGEKYKETEKSTLPFAYPLDSSFKFIPLIDEIVEIVEFPSEKLDQSTSDTKKYYKRVVNIFNSPNTNNFPDIYSQGYTPFLGENIEENENIRNLVPYPGDTLIEGRLGQSLRFSGYLSKRSPLSDENNNGKPFIILRNTTTFDEKVDSYSIENVNNDDSSIYLTSDHTVPLNEVNKKRDTYKGGNYNPDSGQEYRGRQVVIDSGRLFFNGKDDSILLSSKESIGLSSKSVNIDSDEYIGLDSNKIYLGKNSIPEKEWVIRGQQNENWLIDLLDLLESLANTISVLPPVAAGIATAFTQEGVTQKIGIELLRAKLATLRSKKVFTE